MATNHHTSQTEKRTITQKEIKDLAEQLAAHATPKYVKNQASRDRLKLASVLLGVLHHEHPNGLTIEIRMKNGNGEG
jgi:hypothetical protein